MPKSFTRETFDQQAARFLLQGEMPGSPKLQALERHARIVRGEECPECGSHDTEDNGSTEFRCTACDHRWGDDGEPYGY